MAHADAAIPIRLALRGSAARRRREATVRAVLLVAALSTIAISGFIVYTVAIEAAKFLTSVDLSDLVAIGWFPRRGMFDISTLLLGTLMVTAIAMLLAAPVGLASAIYLSEYATPRVRHIVKPSHRDPGRHPEHRPGVLRPDLHQPEDRPGHLSGSASVHDPGGWYRGGDPVDPARRHGRRGRDAGRAPVATGSVVRPRRTPPDDQRPGGRPGGHLRDRRGAHPGREPRDRRDDGRRARGRSHRRRRAQLRPRGSRPDDDGGHGRDRDRQRPGEGCRQHLPEPVLRRAPCSS